MNEIEKRTPIWNAISNFYLDTELETKDYDLIYEVMKESGKPITVLKEIDLYEVFPILQINLNNVAGEWNGFDRKWLHSACLKNYKKRSNILFRFITRLRNKRAYWMRKDHWNEIESRFKNK